MSTWGDTTAGEVRIKVCGVRTESDIDAAVEAGAHAVGLVLAEGSPRQIDRATAARLAAHCGTSITPVCLLMNPPAEALRDLPTRWLQLHGDESDACIAAAAQDHLIIKAVPAMDAATLQRIDANSDIARLLVDAPVGGSGEVFDYDAFAELRSALSTPLVVAGGLTPATVPDAITRLHPWGVDVSSGVERDRGVKDHALIAAFCAAVGA